MYVNATQNEMKNDLNEIISSAVVLSRRLGVRQLQLELLQLSTSWSFNFGCERG